MSARVYERKFDWDKAKREHKQGMSITEIARRHDVSYQAVKRVIDPRTRARMAAASAAWASQHREVYRRLARMGTCTACGNSCRTIAQLCESCYRAKVTKDKGANEAGALWCMGCSTFQPPVVFPHDPRFPKRGFRNQRCRSCQAKLRQGYRERHKIPCEQCGKPRLPATEKRKPGSKDTGLCLACYRDSISGRVIRP